MAATTSNIPNEQSRRQHWTVWLIITGLVIGGVIIPFVGWIAGVIGLWVSPLWRRWPKIVGTFVLPGGLLPAAYLLIVHSGKVVACDTYRVTVANSVVRSGTSCPAHISHPVGMLLVLAVFIIGPLISAAVLVVTKREPNLA